MSSVLCETITIGAGTRGDLDALARHHYRGGRPATIARRSGGGACVLAARDDAGRLAGVLAVSMPTLNGSWRALAWPGVYDTGEKRRDAPELNRSLRCISRVIIGPRFRGLGVATRLVRAYLADPLTRRTEAVASMGRYCRFFERAGMTAYWLPPSGRDARLLDALASLALEPWELLAPGAAAGAIDRAPWLAREARAWANASRATRRHADADPARLLTLGALHASEQPIAYAHGG